MHEVLVNRLGGLSLPRKSVVRLTDGPDMTLDVYRGRKTTIQQQQPMSSDIQHDCAERGVSLDCHDTSVLLQFTLDCSKVATDFQFNDSDIRAIERQTMALPCTWLCHALLIERVKKLPHTDTTRSCRT